MAEHDKEKLLARVDPHRRDFLKKILGVGFTAPVIASFAVESTVKPALAQPSLLGNETFDPYLFESFFFST